MISLATSTITDKVAENIACVLDENRLGQGRFIKEFEQKVADYMGVKYAIAVSSGSMADMVTIAALKAMKPKKTEVIVPALTFIAQTNSVLINGLKPVFVDVGVNYQIDIKQVEKTITKNTLAIMAVHLLGRACEIEKLKDICKKHKIYLVEDCCEAYGGETNGKKFGTFGEFGTFSFYPSHTITTGEGGMVITNDKKCYEYALAARNHGRTSNNVLDMFHFKNFGFNGKMSNVTAAIGAAVVELADEVIEKRKQNVNIYNHYLNKDWYASSPHCYPVVYSTRRKRDKMLKKLEKNGIEARKLFSCLPTQENVYRDLGYKKGDFPVAEKIGEMCLFTPIHQNLSAEDIFQVCKVLKNEN